MECIGSYTVECIGEAEEGCQTIPGIFRLSGPWAIHTVSGYLSVLFTYFFAPVFLAQAALDLCYTPQAGLLLDTCGDLYTTSVLKAAIALGKLYLSREICPEKFT